MAHFSHLIFSFICSLFFYTSLFLLSLFHSSLCSLSFFSLSFRTCVRLTIQLGGADCCYQGLTVLSRTYQFAFSCGLQHAAPDALCRLVTQSVIVYILLPPFQFLLEVRLAFITRTEDHRRALTHRTTGDDRRRQPKTLLTPCRGQRACQSKSHACNPGQPRLYLHFVAIGLRVNGECALL